MKDEKENIQMQDIGAECNLKHVDIFTWPYNLTLLTIAIFYFYTCTCSSINHGNWQYLSLFINRHSLIQMNAIAIVKVCPAGSKHGWISNDTEPIDTTMEIKQIHI